MKRKQVNSVYAFLSHEGILQTGNSILIEQGKQLYWRRYRAEWKKAKRHQSKSFTVLCSFKEAKIITAFAAQHNLSTTRFIKESALADKPLIDISLLGRLRELLILHHSELRSLLLKTSEFKKVTECISTVVEMEYIISNIFVVKQ